MWVWYLNIAQAYITSQLCGTRDLLYPSSTYLSASGLHTAMVHRSLDDHAWSTYQGLWAKKLWNELDNAHVMIDHLESQSQGGGMSGPMPSKICGNHGRSSSSIAPSCTHCFIMSNITCFAADYVCTPARSLNTSRWVMIRVLLGTDRATFVMIVVDLATWAIYTQWHLQL